MTWKIDWYGSTYFVRMCVSSRRRSVGYITNRLRCDMNDHGLTLIRLAANGELLFHMGTWGGAAGYRWCGPDGTEAGIVPPWEDDVLDALAERGMLTIETRLGPLDRRVVPTRSGMDILDGYPRAA